MVTMNADICGGCHCKIMSIHFAVSYASQTDYFPPQGPPGLLGMKGDSGGKGEKVSHYYDANLKLLYCGFSYLLMRLIGSFQSKQTSGPIACISLLSLSQ